MVIEFRCGKCGHLNTYDTKDATQVIERARIRESLGQAPKAQPQVYMAKCTQCGERTRVERP